MLSLPAEAGASTGIQSSAWADSRYFGPELHQYSFPSLESAASFKLFHQPRMHWRVLEDIHHMASLCAYLGSHDLSDFG
ncbi:hypothetical protein V6N13_072136 [Hibiscus sabdariffa]